MHLLVTRPEPDAADLKARLTPLDKPDSVWRLPIREVYALAAWREGRYEDAFKLASEIAADPAAPQGMRQRAQIMAAVELADKVRKVPATKALNAALGLLGDTTASDANATSCDQVMASKAPGCCN